MSDQPYVRGTFIRGSLFLALILGTGGCAGCTPTPNRARAAEESAPPPQDIGPPGEPAAAQTTAVETDLRATLTPQNDRLLGEHPGQLTLLLKLEGRDGRQGERPPLDLTLIIDTSGSMAGEKIQSVKIAALELLKQMRPEDRITLITYSNNVQLLEESTPLTATGVERLRNRILSVPIGGGTALGPAIIAALRLTESRPSESGRLSHLLLLSDGEANIGERRPEVLAGLVAQGFDSGSSVSTLGVGLDYNEDLMTRLADHGGGQYHFVDDNESVAAVLQDELNGLGGAAAREIRVRLTPAPNTAIEEIYGRTFASNDGAAEVVIGTLRVGRTRDLLIRTRYTQLPEKGAPYLTAAVSYTAADRNGAATTQTATATVQQTDDPDAVRASEHAEVTVRLAEVKGAAALETAARAVDSGAYDQASSLLQSSITALKAQAVQTPSDTLNSQIVTLETAEREIVAAKSDASQKKRYVKKTKAAAYTTQKVGRKRPPCAEKISTSPCKEEKRSKKKQKAVNSSEGFW